VVALSTYEA
jgi:hypothetical protein